MAVETEVRDGVGEVRIETGYGRIATRGDTSGRNIKVEIKAEHLTDPVIGWADSTDRDVLNALMLAYDNDRRVFYRVETHRRHDVPDTVPIDTILSDLTPRQKVRELAELLVVDRDGRPLTAGKEPTEEEEPAPAAEVEQPTLDTVGNEEEPAERQPERRRTRVEEARPWQGLNTDGSINLGSYAVLASEAMVTFAYALMVDAGVEATPGRLKSLARRLLNASDRVQAASRADGHADRMDFSHARARAAVTAALRQHPVPFGAGADEVAAWETALVTEAGMLMGVVLDLVDREVA